MSSKQQELKEIYDDKLQNEKDKIKSGAVAASEKLPSANEAIEALEKDLSGFDEDFSLGILTRLGALSLTNDPHGFGFLFMRSF